MTEPSLINPEMVAALRRRRPILHHHSGATYHLVPIDDAFEATAAQIEQIVAICNQPHTYRLLFQDRFGGTPYAPTDAHTFITWGRQGWSTGSYFTWLVLADDAEVAAGIDIKSADLTGGEVGYWLSRPHSGLMTNTVTTVSQAAREAGYVLLWALVRPENEPSALVLRRAGFHYAGGAERNGQCYHRYLLPLDSPSSDAPA